MQVFSIREKGYDVSEVDKALSKIRAEYEEKLRKQDEELSKTKASFKSQIEQNNKQISLLEQNITKLDEIIKDYQKRDERAQNILDASSNLKKLEVQRLQILYSKWENVVKNLKTSMPFLSKKQFDDIFLDFQNSLKVVVNSSNQIQNDQTYAKSVLSRMSGGHLESEKIITKKYVSKFTSNSFEETAVVQEEVVMTEPSKAEQFLNGDEVVLPKSLGTHKEVLTFPGQAKKRKKKQGFSLEEALTPKESLSEIMSVFKLDD